MSEAGFVAPGRPAIKVNQWLELGKFNGFHWILFFLCWAFMTMDGYDLYVYGSAIPMLMKAFRMGPAQAGMIASAASVGVLFGALIFGPFADKVGRKRTILVTTVVMCAGMAFAGLSAGIYSIAVARFIFGVGNGGQVPNIMALASEYVPGRSRTTSLAVISSGASLGGMTGALMGIFMFARWGWRPVFFVACTPIVLVPLGVKFLPEATSYLYRKNRLNDLRKWLGKARPQDTLPENANLEVDKGHNKVPLREVFHEGRAPSTVLLWICYGVNLYVMYGFVFWLPKLMMNHGFSLNRSLSFMVILSLAAIIGSFIVGRFADRFGSRPVLVVMYLLTFVSVTLVGFASNYWLLMVLVALAGVGINCAQNTINGYIPAYYPPSMRSTAMSYNFGIGRLGGIFGPTAVGVLMAMHFSYQFTITALALPSVISAICILCVREKYDYARQLAKVS